jgi:putative addiction module component (TIGR02574 family)
MQQTSSMATDPIRIDAMSNDERIALMGRLWDSLEPDMAAPMTPELAAELVRRASAAEANPAGGIPWPDLREELRARLK